MAGDWIKIENTTPDKPEVFRMADSLGIDPDAVTGKLIRIWIWADQQTVDGNAGSVTRSLLDRLAGVSGFAKAMSESGWLLEEGGQFLLPNFERHNGKTAKTRAQTRKRVESHRKNCNADSVTSALPEKRREEKSITHTHTQREQILNHPAVEDEWREDWGRWLDSWESRMGKPLDPVVAEVHLMDLASKEPAKAAADLRFSLGKSARSILDSDNDFQKASAGKGRSTAKEEPFTW
ncbi:hypothetical protein [Planctomycetes bacterium TBK1r]|uniref:Uncharacterized protein n=1 Tax=Stieleria magnilauensis TaxID=2527963 RepID=A0ABX5XZY5_9BACT|nr:hypothetical protein TBK1r_59840 [Planctomycetes bacterium TBK1r]QDV87035.1 hypothetical protein TBK1r_60620 [Planctomycetes bacterium TBK1r]